MKKKISSILALLLTVIVLVGCSSTIKPTSVVENYFEDINKGANSDLVKSIVSENISSNEISKEGQEAILNMLSKVEVKVKNETVDGDTAKVDVTVKGFDFGTIIESYMSKILKAIFVNLDLDEAQIEQLASDLLIESINEATVEERDCTINLTKANGKWKVSQDEALSEAIFGITEEEIDRVMEE